MLAVISLTSFGLGITIKGLFGGYCTGNEFHHDEYMAQLAASLTVNGLDHHQSQSSNESAAGDDSHIPAFRKPTASKKALRPDQTLHCSQETAASLSSIHCNIEDDAQRCQPADNQLQIIDLTLDSDVSHNAPVHRETLSLGKRAYGEFADRQHISDNDDGNDKLAIEDTSHLIDSQGSSLSARRLETRRNAFNAMIGDASVISVWDGLLSTTNNHTHPESELGEG